MRVAVVENMREGEEAAPADAWLVIRTHGPPTASEATLSKRAVSVSRRQILLDSPQIHGWQSLGYDVAANTPSNAVVAGPFCLSRSSCNGMG
jgi:hypothetical protein